MNPSLLYCIFPIHQFYRYDASRVIQTGIQRQSQNYFRAVVTIPFLDHVIKETDERFSEAPTTVMKGLGIIPSILLNEGGDWKGDFMEFKVYDRDLVSIIALNPELHMWETFWMQSYRGAIPFRKL